MTTLDNQDNNIFPLTLDGLNYISVNGLNLNDQAGVLQALNDGSVYADYNVRLDQITPASAGNTIDIAGNAIIDNQIAINGATFVASFGANIGGNLNITGTYLVNGVPLTFSGSNWQIYGTGIYRNSNVGVGLFSTGNLLYDFQLGQIGTTQAKDKTISIPVAVDRNAKIRLSECGASATESEAGFDLQLNGANNRFEILSGANAVPAGQAFTTRCLTIDRNTGNVSIGSSIDITRPLTVYGGATISNQLRAWGATNASIAVQGTTGLLEMCIAGATGNFSTDANTADAVIRHGNPNARKLLLQMGQGRSAIAIDQNNNVGIGVANNLSNAMTISGSLAITNNNIFVLGATNGVQLGNNAITNLNGIFRDNALNGVALWANNNTAIRSNSSAEMSMGATVPVAGVRLTTDGSIRVNGNVDIRGGNQLQFNGVQASTTNIPEGSNLYYLDSRARGAISVTSTSTLSLTYNSSLGIISGDLIGATSNWSPFGNTGIFRNSRIGVNATFCGTASALYIRTSAGIGGGIQIDSESTGSLSIRQKTLNNHEIIQSFSEGNGYAATRTVGANSQFFQIDSGGNFCLNNSLSASGCNLRLTTDINSGIGNGFQINFDGSNCYQVNQTGGGNIQFWTNNGAGIDERWRISSSGCLNNVDIEDSVNALRVSGNILFNNLAISQNAIVSSGASMRLFVSGSGGLTIDSNNNLTVSGFNFAPLKPHQIFSLTSVVAVDTINASFLSASFYKIYTTSNIELKFDTNCRLSGGTTNQNCQLIPYLHSATGAYLNRLAATQYYFAINPTSTHVHPSFTRLCTGITGGQTYTIRFLYSGLNLTVASSNQLFGTATEVPL